MKNLAIVLLVFGCILGCKNSASLENKSPSPASRPVASPSAAPVKPIEISVGELVAAYDENEIAADAKYKGKRLRIYGPVSEISETLGTVSVTMNTMAVIGVTCRIAESERPKATQLKKGQTAELEGDNQGLTLGVYLTLNECVIK